MNFISHDFFSTRRIYLKVFKTVKVQISSSKVQDFGLQVPDLICKPFKIAILRVSGTVEPEINAHRRTLT